MVALDDNLLATIHGNAAALWPEVHVSRERFAATLAAAFDGEQSLDGVHAGDLYLALACLDGQARALAAFEQQFVARVRPSVERACRGAATNVDDVMQWTREKLLVGEPPSPPKLGQYTGRGSLLGWVRVVAVREALQDRRRSKKERIADDVRLLEEASPAATAELEVLRERHGSALRVAIEGALHRLTPEQRSLLRFHTRDALTIDQLAPLLGVHRATAARRLEKARADALQHTRAILHEQFGLSESEARSLCIALGTDVEVSVGRALEDEAYT